MFPQSAVRAPVSCVSLILLFCSWDPVEAEDVCPSGYFTCGETNRPYKIGRDVMAQCCDTAPNCYCDHACNEDKPQPCILPMEPGRREEYKECISECNTKALHVEDSYETQHNCYRYCDFQQRSDKSPVLALVTVSLFSITFGIAAGLSSRLLECSKQASTVAGVFTSIVVVLFGLLPLSTDHPMVCSEVSWVGGFGIMIFPITFVGAGGSFFGLAVACAWLRSKRTRHALGKLATTYFLMVSVCNTAGVIGVLHMSCHQEHLRGLPFYIGWLVSSFITNLVLQKIVVMRATLVDKSRLPSILRCLFSIEVIIATILFGGSMFLAMSASTRDHETRTNVARENQSDEDKGKAQIIAIIVVMISLLFIIFDLFFSCVSAMAMRSGITRIKEITVSGVITRTISQSSGLFHWGSTLERAVFFARLNLVLVVLSVTTTTVFYLAFIVMTFVWVVDTSEREAERRFAFLFIAWLLDSIFNDICVTFVGFGPTSNALETVGDAAKADIIGAATTETSILPEGSMCIGTVVHDTTAVHSAQDLPTPSSKNGDLPTPSSKNGDLPTPSSKNGDLPTPSSKNVSD